MKPSNPRHERIRQLAAEGVRRAEIARRVGLSASTVTIVLGPAEGTYPHERDEQILQLAAQGITRGEIARQVGVSTSTVYRVCKATHIENEE